MKNNLDPIEGYGWDNPPWTQQSLRNYWGNLGRKT
jgi:hypothetical protein